MLSFLKIENIAIIESAEMEFSDGLNVLSGETGAGKSIIIDSISSVLGERTSRDLIRTGASKAKVTALFSNISKEVIGTMEELDMEPSEDGSLLITRTLQADGRNACKVNGSPVTATMLRQLGKQLISIHGQHDSQNLLNSEYHYRYLDILGDLDSVFNTYNKKYTEYLALYREFRNIQKNAEEASSRIDFLQFEIKEIEDAGIQVGEFEELQRKRDLYRNSEKVMNGLRKALSDLSDSEESRGAVSLLFDATGAMEPSAKYLPDMDKTLGQITEAAYTVQESVEVLKDALYNSNYDPKEQAEVEDRLALLQKLRSKYGPTEEDILEYLKKEKKELYQLEHRQETGAELEKQLEEKKGALLDSAKALHDARVKTAEEFENQVGEELRFLNMPNVVIKTSFTHCKLNATGSDIIEFLISTNPGEALKPLAKIASGGELSRIMLAIQNVLSSKGNVQTMIFDEIDTGVSGSEAERIAKKLHSVAEKNQVLCITHSAQVASYADAHMKISKEVQNGKTYTRVKKLDHKGRVEELARIIGGENITDLQRQSAEEMLTHAGS